ncbi:MAG: mevalonate kinase [Kofleriaceae bacterium]
MTAIGWGKLILLGEHAVVYGYPALAAALDRGVTIAPVPTTKGGMRIDIPGWNVAVRADDDHPVARCLSAIADALELGRPALSLVGDAQIPFGAGLGSSAALAVAVARALLAHAKRPLTASALEHAATASEMIVHGKPSGVDVALAIAGGVGVFRRSTGLRAIACPALRVLVGPSGEPRSTGVMVQRVAEATESNRDDNRLSELGALTDDGTRALVARDLVALGAAMNRAHGVLAELGVSTPLIDSLCEAARVSGAHGAKLTGAGGGGAVIAIAPRDKEAAILTEWRAAGVTGFVATIGART